LELAGLPPLPHTDGRSLVPLVLRSAGAPTGDPVGNGSSERPTFAQLDRTWGRPDGEPHPIVAMVVDDYRMVVPLKAPARAELYDRSSDPGEVRNLVAKHPELRQKLSGELEAYGAVLPAWGEAPEVEIDAMRLEQLRALGYVVGERGRPNRNAGAGGRDGIR
jgi:arylsulfatase A-like enzyme